MPHGNRKVPFSCKRKKEQIALKRQINKSNLILRRKSSDDDSEGNGSGEYEYGKFLSNVKSVNKQPSNSTNRNPNKYNLQFHEESKKEVQQMKKEALLPFQKIQDDDMEIDDNYFRGYDFPKRPKWDHNMSKESLSQNENRYFKEYIDKVMKVHNENNPNTSIFELNLETWRQLWRVIEMSDILLIVVDARYPSLMFPPDLFDYLQNKLKKNVILILNKVDLISSESALAWKNYFTEKYHGIHVIYFASYTRQPEQHGKYYRKRKKNLFSWESIKKVCEICKELVSGHDIDLTSWEQKILEDSQMDSTEKLKIDHLEEGAAITTEYDESCIKYKNGILTIGCIGFPNVGKSSIINSLKGRKVVSVSKTPGHTKHFQTIFLTENVKLCDSPGLVFPSKTPKYLQVIVGSFPIAQLREPNRSLMYVGERIDLPKILNINLPNDFDQWSAVAVCEAWCLKRGFLTAKASRPDHYRAANNLLRLILEGKIVIQHFPVGFKNKKDELLKNLVELENIRRIQGCDKDDTYQQNSFDSSVIDDDNTEEESGSESNNYNIRHEKGSRNTSQGRKQENFYNLLESD